MDRDKLRRVNTPLRRIGIKMYNNEAGERWIRFGSGPRRRLSRGWLRVIRWSSVLGLLAIIGFIGFQLALSYASNKLMSEFADQLISPEEVQLLLQDPELRQLITEHADAFGKDKADKLLQSLPPAALSEDSAAAAKQQSSASGAADSDLAAEPASRSMSAAAPLLTDKEQATRLLLSKFSMNELTALADIAKDGLTQEEKQELKDTLLSRLTEEEFQALKIIALFELMEQQAN